MKIALIGSAPSSVGLAPYGDPSWQEIWGCSPGAYYRVSRLTAWFETHRWEPPVLGKPESQRTWFSPEYVGWMYKQPVVWGFDLPSDMPNGKEIPHQYLRGKYGDYFFTSTLAWMMAMAIEAILAVRKADPSDEDPHAIGLWGVDMAAFEEYGYQRAGCQFFAQVAQSLGISVIVPHESDLLTPPPLYGLCELSHKAIKMTARREELTSRLSAAQSRLTSTQEEVAFLRGALDDMQYMWGNWLNEGGAGMSADFSEIFENNVSDSG